MASKVHFLEFMSRNIGEINPYVLYFSGIVFVFILGFNAVYSSPNSFSATGSETIADPLLRAVYVTGLFSILWPILLFAGIAIDSLLVGNAVYYPFKGIICGNFFIQLMNSSPIQLILFPFSSFMLFFNGPLYFLLLIVLIKYFKCRYDLSFTSSLKQPNL